MIGPAQHLRLVESWTALWRPVGEPVDQGDQDDPQRPRETAPGTGKRQE